MVKFYHFGDSDKKTLLLLHGWGSPYNIFHEYITMFQNKYHIIVPSYHGYNGEKDVHSIGVDGNAMQINQYLKNKGVKIYAVIGVSFGANVALKLADMNEVPTGFVIADAPNISKDINFDMAKAMADLAGSYQENADTLKPQFIETYSTVWGEKNAQLQCEKLFSIPSIILKDDAFSYFSYTMSAEHTRKTKSLIFQCYGSKEIDKIQNSDYIGKLFENCHTKIFEGEDHCECFMGNSIQYADRINSFLKEYQYFL